MTNNSLLVTARKYRWLFIVLISFLVIYNWRIEILELSRFLTDQEQLRQSVDNSGIFIPITLGVFLLLQVIIAVFPGQPIIFAFGYIYGLEIGFLINLFAIVAGSQLAFAISRRFGRPIVDKLAPKNVIDRWDSVATRFGFNFFLLMFLIPLLPGDSLNYLAGVTSLPGKKFFVANLVGKAPQLYLITWAGANGYKFSLFDNTEYNWLFTAAVLLIALIFWRRFSAHINDLDL